MTARTRCPAKINLFLAVGPKDARGWHPLRTVFQAVDLCDSLTVSLSDRDEFTTDVSWLPEDNSVSQAVRALRREIPVPPLRIKLEKRIPAKAGLGGGSSDAAGILRAVPELAGAAIPETVLRSIALDLGADVPFFLVGGRARGEGYGQILTPLPDPAERFYLVVKPEVDCPTGEMYARLDLRARSFRDFGDEEDYHNDFSEVAPGECHRAMEHLSVCGATGVGLSGSGSAVFGSFGDHTATLTGAALMRSMGYEHVWPTCTLSRTASLAVDVDIG